MEWRGLDSFGTEWLGLDSFGTEWPDLNTATVVWRGLNSSAVEWHSFGTEWRGLNVVSDGRRHESHIAHVEWHGLNVVSDGRRHESHIAHVEWHGLSVACCCYSVRTVDEEVEGGRGGSSMVRCDRPSENRIAVEMENGQSVVPELMLCWEEGGGSPIGGLVLQPSLLSTGNCKNVKEHIHVRVYTLNYAQKIINLNKQRKQKPKNT